MTAPELTLEDHATLLDLAMWQEKLRHLANVRVERRWLGGDSAPVPGHSVAFYDNLASWRFRWDAKGDSGVGGAIGLSRHGWRQNDSGYGFAPDEHFLIADLHNDQAMAFFRYRDGEEMDTAAIVGASAGEEGEASYLAGSIGAYVRDAIAARFGNYWFLGGSYASQARAWVDAQPLDPTPRFEVTVASVELPDVAALRQLAVAWLDGVTRKRLATAAGYKGDDAAEIVAALATALAGKPAAVNKLEGKLRRGISGGAWRETLMLHELAPDLRLVRLRARRLGTAYLHTYRGAQAQQAAQLLLDAPGSEALAAAVSTDLLRFCATRGRAEANKVVFAALVKEPEKALKRRQVLGEVELAVLLPAALVPTGCVAGARFPSIAPASDGVLHDGKVMKSV